MHSDVERIIYSKEQIENRCIELGKIVSEHYGEETPIVVGLLKGSVPFMAELCKNIECDMEMEFMDVSSYSGTVSNEVKIVKDIEGSVTNRSVLLVEDIIDTGKTLKKVKELMYHKGAKDVKIITLLDKREARVCDVQADWYGFEIPNEFVIGFGLDYNQKYRNLPYIGVIKKSAI